MFNIDYYLVTAILFAIVMVLEPRRMVSSLIPVIFLVALSNIRMEVSSFTVLKVSYLVSSLLYTVALLESKLSKGWMAFLYVLIPASVGYIVFTAIPTRPAIVSALLTVAVLVHSAVEYFTSDEVRRVESIQANAVAIVGVLVMLFSQSYYTQFYAIAIMGVFQLLCIYQAYVDKARVKDAQNKRLNDLEERFKRQVEIESKKMTSMLSGTVAEYRDRSQRDALTKALNRDGMSKQIKELIEDQGVSTFSFAILDIDKFKGINDTFGHIEGDRALVYLSNYLMMKKRSSDILGRYGGDEFILLMPNVSANQAMKAMERHRIAIQEYSDPRMTISVGIAAYPYDGDTFEKLLKVSDKSLYDAKREGRNCVVYSGSEPIHPDAV